MRITSEQLASWKEVAEKRRTKNTANDIPSADKFARFVFQLSLEQMEDIFLLLQPIVNQYKDLFDEFDRYICGGRPAPSFIDEATKFFETDLSDEQRLAVFLGFHSDEAEIRTLATTVLWMTHFRSLDVWSKSSYADNMTRSDTQRVDDRQDALTAMYELYEMYDPFRGDEGQASFNHYANKYLPFKLARRRMPAGITLDEYVSINKLKSIRKNLAKKYNIREEQVPSEDALKEYNKRNVSSLYTAKKKNNVFYRELNKLAEETGRDPSEISDAEVEEAYAYGGKSRLSIALYNKYVNFQNPSFVPIDQEFGSEEDGQSLLDVLDGESQMWYSEDILPPEQQIIKKEADQELHMRLKKILTAIPDSELMLDIIMEYTESQPDLRAQKNLKKVKGKKRVKESELRDELSKLFIDEVGSRYSTYTGNDLKISCKYAENALKKLTQLQKGHIVIASDLIYDETSDGGIKSPQELYEDIFQDDNKELRIFAAPGVALKGFNFSSDIDNRDKGDGLIEFDEIFDF